MVVLKDKYFTISQATGELNVTRQTISRWIKQGKLSAERIGRETLITKKEVQRLQHERVHESLMIYLANYLQDRLEYKTVKGLKPVKGNLRFSAIRSDGSHEILQIPIATIKLVTDKPGYYHIEFKVITPEKAGDKEGTSIEEGEKAK